MELGASLKPDASTDAWWREIVTPASAGINNAHDLKNTPMIRVMPCDNFERIAQFKRRSKPSRVERKGSIQRHCLADPMGCTKRRNYVVTQDAHGQPPVPTVYRNLWAAALLFGLLLGASECAVGGPVFTNTESAL